MTNRHRSQRDCVLAAQGCAKVNLQIRSEHVAAADFYEAVGYEIDDVISMGKRLGAD